MPNAQELFGQGLSEVIFRQYFASYKADPRAEYKEYGDELLNLLHNLDASKIEITWFILILDNRLHLMESALDTFFESRIRGGGPSCYRQKSLARSPLKTMSQVVYHALLCKEQRELLGCSF